MTPYEQGRKGWGTHQSLPNPYKPRTHEYREYDRGLEDEAAEYDMRRDRRK